MIRKLILIITLSVLLSANLDMKVKDLLGNSDYNTHKNLINHIFSNEANFYTNNQIDYTKIIQELSNNGVLKLNLPSTQNISITFNVNKYPKKSSKNLGDILRALGQHNFIVQEEIVVNNNLKWTIQIKTAAAISPLRLSQELQSINCRIVDIKREGDYNWNYSIDTSDSSVYRAEDLINNKELSLKKPLKPYMIKVSNTKVITIKSSSGNIWYPNVVFYDEALNIIGIYEENSLHKSLRLEVPNNTKYIKIDDLYTLANMKQGINITKE
ncbi:hypothetical protein CKA55_01620 [Arcobacter suis]|uniref:Periplasmic protein n=1 Tax=Arcobacter suis CECT 7833 TaxID=663365 RepID=A0AAD0SPD3_9BACT|nr:hypothetical protein [Arcobacter suis]AXX88639.1 hypothetical protein ASUIS_0121 [Arcobacter suis CECT 7833]RWS47532.1 hypothetical protein CKA55_01620 [Arcobacter suis]